MYQREAQSHANLGYIRFPTISGDRIVFTAEDDLWLVQAAGGRAERLTAGTAEATRPRFSPDGRLLAFVGMDEGPAEVYVMPAEGGAVRRLTYQGDQAQVTAWTPDGARIVYSTSADQPSRRMRVLASVAPDGGPVRFLPYGLADAIAYGPGGAIALGRNVGEPARWKRYRGGTAGYFWVDPYGNGEFRRLLNLNTNMAAPCWVGGRCYFISDHEGIGNVYSCLPSGEDIRRHTDQSEYYARGLSTDGHRLVYFAGGDLYLLNPDAARGQRLNVTLPGSRTQRSRRFVPAAKYLETWRAHPKGSAVALTTRGRAFSMGNWEGPVLQHGESDGPRYRLTAWMGDGKRLIAVHDDGTEPRLAVLGVDGAAPERILDTIDIGHVVDLRPAPLGEHLLLLNHRNEFLLVDVAAGTARVLDQSPYGREMDINRMHGLAWSADGQWIAYAFRINPRQTIIKLANAASGETQAVTEPVLNDLEPAFDPEGRYLYFIGSRDFDPVEDRAQFAFSFPRTQRPYLVTLRRDLRSPFMPEPEPPKDELEEKLEELQKEQREDRAEARRGRPEPVRIDLEGITSRIVAFPVPEGRYGRIQGTPKGVVFSSFPVEGTRGKEASDSDPESNGSLEAYSFESRKQEHLADAIMDFEVTPDGRTLFYQSAERLRALPAGEKLAAENLPPEARDKPGRESGWLELDRVKVSIRPETEWRQMFAEAWRLQREQFWVRDMAGVNWQAIYQRYAPLVDRVGSRGELSDLFWEMQGELGSSHAYEFGGEYRPHPEYRQGFLGVDWAFDPGTGRYLIARIVRGDPWNQKATSPLLAPGVNVGVGDAILAVNGQRVSAQRTPQQLLVHQADSEVQLVVQPAAGGDARTVTVRALREEYSARYRDWVEHNRRFVHEATGGRVGYLHIPDMMWDGFAEFHRYYLAEYDHDALIVDVRFNGGGMVSALVLEKLVRRRIGYDFQRWGPPTPYMPESPRGPLVALTDEHAGSDGDIFSHGFKMLGLGPLIGKRTWGGVIGISPYIRLADGTETTQPEFSFWFSDVGWGVENYGTDPTIEVDYPPQAYAAGTDPQLDRGIAEARKLLDQRQTAVPEPDPYPFRGWPRRQP